MKTLHQVDVRGKTVLTRVDFNVPLRNGEIADDTRIKAHLETIQHLINEGAKTVLITHLGNGESSLKPVAEHLSKLLSKPVLFVENCIGENVEDAVKNLTTGGVILLENVRKHKEEKENDRDFASQLAKLGDIYVNDAFATAHREHASVCAITDFFDTRAAGILMGREIATLTQVMQNASKPFSVIVGGAKVSTKLGMLNEIVGQADHLFIGGAMANTFLQATGHNMGASFLENSMIDDAKEILEKAARNGCKVHLPKDVVAAKGISENGHHHVCLIDKLPADQMALDIGPHTTQEWFRAIDGSATVLWNGPMGAFEIEHFQVGTTALAHELASMTDCYRVLGGGDTIAALKQAGVMERFDLVSTGGGAMLRFLEGDPLPAIEALKDSMH